MSQTSTNPHPTATAPESSAPTVIIGAGLAGMVVALAMEPHPVTLLSFAALGEKSSSALAQGGLAAVLDETDTPESHAADTMAAGAGACDPAIVDLVVRSGAQAVARLESWGVHFAKQTSGAYDLHLEAAHATRRVAHISGDGTGAGIVAALIACVRQASWITVIEHSPVTALLRDENGIVGVVTPTRTIPAAHVVLATGGAGALWRETTAPLESWGRGLALAEQIGATLKDLRFVQFHPTGLDVGRDPFPLVSEAVRGEGARLLQEDGTPLLDSDLAPRDVVARAIWAANRESGSSSKPAQVFLDARKIKNFKTRFPAVDSFCAEANLDPAQNLLPVKPVAHYHMGGIKVDREGRTTVKGLWAVGEVAATGLHGANRLASNSLLEATVFGLRLGQILPQNQRQSGPCPALTETERATLAAFATPSPKDRAAIRAIMSTHVGVVRDAQGLSQACEALKPLSLRSAMGRTALLIAQDALACRESRGSHYRADDPAQSSFSSISSSSPLISSSSQGT